MDLNFPAFFKFFWLFCGFWAGGGNALYFRLSLRRAINEGTISTTEANNFTLGVIFWIGGPCLLLWAIQYFFIKTDSPVFLEWENPWRDIAVIGNFIWLATAFIWVWFLGGAKKLARIYELARYQAFIWRHPIAHKISVTILVVVCGFTLLNYNNLVDDFSERDKQYEQDAP